MQVAILYSLKVIFISWVVGHASILLLKGVIPLNKWLQLNFIKNKKLNKLIGVGICKGFLANSFVKYFNHRLQISRMPDVNELIKLREAMTYAEAVHLIGFAYVIGRVLLNIINQVNQSMIAPLFAANILANLYPVLVQQLNKRRVNCLINSLSDRGAARNKPFWP